jgi:hypothetical protein
MTNMTSVQHPIVKAPMESEVLPMRGGRFPVLGISSPRFDGGSEIPAMNQSGLLTLLDVAAHGLVMGPMIGADVVTDAVEGGARLEPAVAADLLEPIQPPVGPVVAADVLEPIQPPVGPMVSADLDPPLLGPMVAADLEPDGPIPQHPSV